MSIERVRPVEVIQKGKPDVLLINVPASFQQGIIPDEGSPSFGLLRIAVVAEKHSYIPAILDAHRSKFKLF